jgi:hypothetical protein
MAAGARVAGFAAGGGNYVGRFRAERPEFAQGAHRKETVRQYSVGRWPVNFSRGREAKDLLSRALSRKQVLRFAQNHKSQKGNDTLCSGHDSCATSSRNSCLRLELERGNGRLFCAMGCLRFRANSRWLNFFPPRDIGCFIRDIAERGKVAESFWPDHRTWTFWTSEVEGSVRAANCRAALGWTGRSPVPTRATSFTRAIS